MVTFSFCTVLSGGLSYRLVLIDRTDWLNLHYQSQLLVELSTCKENCLSPGMIGFKWLFMIFMGISFENGLVSGGGWEKWFHVGIAHLL